MRHNGRQLFEWLQASVWQNNNKNWGGLRWLLLLVPVVLSYQDLRWQTTANSDFEVVQQNQHLQTCLLYFN